MIGSRVSPIEAAMERLTSRRILAPAAALVLLLPSLAASHPVPRKAHDRTIEIRCQADRVVVHYRLEVDPLTVVYDDLPAIDDRVDLKKLNGETEFYDAFARGYAPILGDNLTATLDGKPLTFHCNKHRHTLLEDDGKKLDHVRFDFTFQADWKPGDGEHHFTFREGNYELEAGMIRIGLEAVAPVEIIEKSLAPKELQERASRDLKPGDEAKLRQASATFRATRAAVAPTIIAPSPPPESSEPGHHDDDHGLFALFFDTSRNLGLLLLLAGVFGAAHALTPGHGKTLVAAYLVGERGTVWHALLLGLSTTVSHTGAVIIVAILMAVSGVDITRGLELVAGIMVTVWGFWLLLRRLAGAPEPLQFGGHSHGGVWHTHGHGAEVSHAHGAAAPVGTWGVVMLGLVGGMVPCWDAIAILGIAPGRALPLVLAFSAGLACTLVAVGVGVVYIKGFSESRWGQGKIVRALPLVSAGVIFAVGLWMCLRSVNRV
jgi:ABC-type nickel/cobalt efflux system permease component RcnA